jgi:hypothetical protein
MPDYYFLVSLLMILGSLIEGIGECRGMQSGERSKITHHVNQQNMGDKGSAL